MARQRRSPMISSYDESPVRRTTTGWSSPISLTECTSSAMASSSKTWRGWRALGVIALTGSSAK